MVLKICGSCWENASRDQRELNVVKELGADVLVMAKGEKSVVCDSVNGFDIIRMSTRPFGKFVPTNVNRIAALFTWAHQVRKIKPTIISGHDLIGVQIGWMSNCFLPKKKRAKIIYDSHEFTIYDGNRSKIEEFFVKYLERFLIKKCSAVMEVADSIADEVVEIHRLEERPTVVRNTPGFWQIDEKEILKTRKEIFNRLNVDAEHAFLLSRHGMVIPGRCLETVIDAVGRNNHIYGLILGNGSEEYIDELRERARKLGVEHKILFHEAVPIQELYKWVGAANVSYVGIEATCKSYLYSLPNKFFESIQSLTPIICSNFPEMGELCNKYGIGIAVNPDNPTEIDDAINRFMYDKEFVEQCKENCSVAKKELCWEKEKSKLIEMYKKVL